MGKTSIEWTAIVRDDGTVVPGYTFNPWWGCQKVSQGCKHCYAEKLANRFEDGIWGPPATTQRKLQSDAYWQKPLQWNEQAGAAGERRRVFCASMADVFEDHPGVDDARADLWELIELTPHLDWLLLTKRPENILRMVPNRWIHRGAPEHVLFGTSVENQEMADERVPELMSAGYNMRSPLLFLSCEPLLGPVHVNWMVGVNWVIIGGESGPGARPMKIEWAQRIIRRCEDHQIPVFLKQLGGFPDKRGGEAAVIDGRSWHEFPEVG